MNRKDMDNFIRAYGKSDLAMLYFPHSNNPHTAVNHLMSWGNRSTYD